MKPPVRRLPPLLAVIALVALAGCAAEGQDVAPRTPEQGGSSAAPSPGASEAEPAEEGPRILDAEEAAADSSAQAEAVRAFYRALAEASNAGDFGSEELRATSTPERQAVNEESMAEYADLRFPGPLPFTALAVDAGSSRASISGCTLDAGWARNAAGEPAGAWTPAGGRFDLVRSGDTWQVDRIAEVDLDCADVPLDTEEW